MLRIRKIFWMVSILILLVSAALAQESNKQNQKQTVAPAAAIGPTSTVIASQAMKLYADPGTTVHLAIRRGPTTGSASCDGHISGFLVDVP